MEEKRGMRKHLSKEQVEHIAWLAKIELSEQEKELFTKQFNEILDYFKKIDESRTEGIEPTYHVLGLTNVFREDEIKVSLPKERVLGNAPKKEKGYFKAPKII